MLQYCGQRSTMFSSGLWGLPSGAPQWSGQPPDLLLLSLQPGGHHGRG